MSGLSTRNILYTVAAVAAIGTAIIYFVGGDGREAAHNTLVEARSYLPRAKTSGATLKYATAEVQQTAPEVEIEAEPEKKGPVVEQDAPEETEGTKLEIAGAAYTALGQVPKKGPQVKGWAETPKVAFNCPDGTPAKLVKKARSAVGEKEYDHARWYCTAEQDKPRKK